MKTLKHISIAALIIVCSIGFTYYFDLTNQFWTVLSFLIIGFFIFNLIFRKSPALKNYFTSPFNLFTTKVRSEKSFNIPKELMFEKVTEVINDSKFKLISADNSNFEIFAISTITFQSWGENIYISFETKGNETVMKFCSSTLFQIYSWGKNEKNFEILVNEIENSLTV